MTIGQRIILLFLTILVLGGITTPHALAQNQRQFYPVISSERQLVAARLAAEPIDNRWASVEVQTIYMFEGGKKLRLKLTMLSVDCASQGVEEIREMFNVETDPDKEPIWVTAPVDPRFEKSFNPKEIQHRPPAQLDEEKYQEAITDADEEVKRSLRRSRAAPVFRSPTEVAVDFTCSVARDGLSDREAAQLMSATAGLKDLKTLACTLRDPSGRSSSTLEMTVRFQEAREFVQVQDSWVSTRSVTPDRISARFRDSDISINRLTGRASLRMKTGSIREGSCEQSSSQRKF